MCFNLNISASDFNDIFVYFCSINRFGTVLDGQFISNAMSWSKTSYRTIELVYFHSKRRVYLFHTGIDNSLTKQYLMHNA